MTDVTPCLGVVMPCYDERSTIKVIVDRVLASPLVAELVIVDDGSHDGMRDVLRDFTDPRVRVIEQPVNQGKGAALPRWSPPLHEVSAATRRSSESR